jgi:hypothetical protein
MKPARWRRPTGVIGAGERTEQSSTPRATPSQRLAVPTPVRTGGVCGRVFLIVEMRGP